MKADVIRAPGPDPRAQIVLTLRRRGVLSRAEIARATGLAKSTVSEIVSELLRSGIVVSSATVRKPARNGRPGEGLTLNPSAGSYVGVDFGFRHVRSVVADVSHRILATSERRVGADYSLDEALSVAGELVAETVERSAVDRESVLGIGVAVPGPFDAAGGTVIGTSMVPTWSGANVRSVLTDLFAQEVILDNDSNCGALAELLWGAGAGSRSLAYIKLHSGVGGAVVVNGELVHGVAGSAGEFGHITVDPNGLPCRCGGRGCLETYVGIPALLDQLSPRLGSTPTLRRLLELAEDGDLACRRVLSDAADMAGRALGIVSNVLAPGLIVVGGALADAGPLLLDPLERSFRSHSIVTRSLAATPPPIQVVPGSLGRNASALGAVALVLTRLGVEQIA